MPDPSTRESYNESPYPGMSYQETHPDRLATMARLLGLEPAPVDNCRMVDIGCGNGVNLFPMALGLPQSEFWGIDYSTAHIEEGKRAIQELGLANVHLECADIMELPDEFPQFDYMVAHGVYSWVPAEVRDKLLALIARHLKPNGIAYVSYNVFPGWRLLQVMRDAMIYHGRNESNPAARAAKAREMVDFMHEATQKMDNVYAGVVANYYDLIKKKMEFGSGSDSLLLHDELELFNRPVYFHEFAAHAERHGLQYLSETALHSVMPSNMAPEVMKGLEGMARNIIQTEQYMDFIKNRTFRRTLLVHKDIEINRTLKPEAIFPMRIFSRTKFKPETPDFNSKEVEHFEGIDESVFSSDHPLTKAAFHHLNSITPRSIAFADLAKEAAKMVGIKTMKELDEEAGRLAAGILKAHSYSIGLVELRTIEPPFVTEVSERPLASHVARWQQAKGYKVTSMRHERVDLEGFTRLIFPLLDGQHTENDMVEKLLQLHQEGAFNIDEDQESEEGREIRELLVKEVDPTLRFISRAAFLVA